jgi:membrane protease YdiL (CAAX protease family)
MPAKTLSIISAVLTVIFVILLGMAFIFLTMVALNGYSGREGDAALIITLVCQGVGLILSGILAGWLTRLFIEKFNWNKILAVILSIFAGSTLGTVLVFAALVLSIFTAGAMWQAGK